MISMRGYYTTKKKIAMGLVHNAEGLLATIWEVRRKLASNMGPIIKPRVKGTRGIPALNSPKARIPNMNMPHTSNATFVMPIAPTALNMIITANKYCLGIFNRRTNKRIPQNIEHSMTNDATTMPINMP